MRKQIRHMAQSKLCLTTLDRAADEVYKGTFYHRTLSGWVFKSGVRYVPKLTSEQRQRHAV